MNPKDAHDLKEHHDIQRDRKPPDLFHVSVESHFFIGMDSIKQKPVITDRNPYLEGLVDIHKCIYLPSSYEKNQNLPENLAQKVTFTELPESPVLTPGIAPGNFFVTPKLGKEKKEREN